MDEVLNRDQNHITVLGGITDDSNQFIRMLRVDPTTKRLLISATGGTGIVSINADTTQAQIIAAGTGITVTDNGTGTHTIAATGGSSGITIGTTTITSGTSTRVLYNNAGVVGEYTLTGTGTVVAMQTSPTFNTSINVAGVIIDASDINVSTNNALVISTNNTNRWSFSATGHFLALTDNTYDIGATGATRPRTVYVGTSVVAPSFVGTLTGNASTVTTNANLTGAVTSSGNATSLGSFSSANLATALTDETGTGANVFASKPTFIGTINTIVAVAALALDGSLGSIFTKTIGTGSTFTQSNFSTGQCFLVKVTGAFTVTWFSGITWITSSAAVPTQGAITTYGLVCTGSNTFDGYLVGTQ